MRRGGAPLVAVAAAWLALAPASAGQEGALYQWTDEAGAVRYTPDPSRVPRAARSTMQVVVPPEPVETAEGNGSPVTPGALPAVMGPKLDEMIAPGDDTPADPAELAQRIDELRSAIARDQATLRTLVAAARDPAAEGPDPQLEAIANRLPLMQAELARLEAAQRQLAPGTQQP
jgi:hypothetical protein